MHIVHWLIGTAFGFGEWIVGFVLKFIPENRCCQVFLFK